MKQKFRSPSELINFLMSSRIRSKYYYRGISESNQKYPTIMRLMNDDYETFEENILNNLIKYGSSFTGSTRNAFDFIGLAQHYGLPTRLLDWTSNPLVALFFSIYNIKLDDERKPKLLLLPKHNTLPINIPLHTPTVLETELKFDNIILDFKLFIKEVNDSNFITMLQKYSEFEFGMDCGELEEVYNDIQLKNRNKNMIIIDIGYSNSRIQAQDGIFYLPRELESSKIDEEYIKSEVIEININPKWRDELLSILDSFGISGFKLFNDLSSICKYIVDDANKLEESLIKYMDGI